jgi:hypothetical protein
MCQYSSSSCFSTAGNRTNYQTSRHIYRERTYCNSMHDVLKDSIGTTASYTHWLFVSSTQVHAYCTARLLVLHAYRSEYISYT